MKLCIEIDLCWCKYCIVEGLICKSEEEEIDALWSGSTQTERTFPKSNNNMVFGATIRVADGGTGELPA
jgi:hypothetical protein